jgi:hypothetical protein
MVDLPNIPISERLAETIAKDIDLSAVLVLVSVGGVDDKAIEIE